MRKNEKITALYERLSRDDFGKDDDQQRESNSISNQKAMLEEFAARQGFTNIVHFTDDGISGTCFDRPGFLAMMKEVEAGNVEYLCIKDMSAVLPLLLRRRLVFGQVWQSSSLNTVSTSLTPQATLTSRLKLSVLCVFLMVLVWFIAR